MSSACEPGAGGGGGMVAVLEGGGVSVNALTELDDPEQPAVSVTTAASAARSSRPFTSSRWPILLAPVAVVLWDVVPAR